MVVVAHDDERRSDLAAKKAHSSHGHNEFHGHYGPAASGLRWVPCAAAVSVVRGMLCASHNDLRLHVQLFSRALSSMFFFAGAGAGLPEGGVFVCADVPPLGPALQDVQRALMQVAVKEASHGACDCYYDTVGDLMRLLVGDAGLFRSAFSSDSVYFSSVESLSRFRGYSPVPAVAAASALRWIPHAAVVSTVRALLGSSHDDLRLRVHQLSCSLSDAFFVVGAAAAPFASGERFPEGSLRLRRPPAAGAGPPGRSTGHDAGGGEGRQPRPVRLVLRHRRRAHTAAGRRLGARPCGVRPGIIRVSLRTGMGILTTEY